MKKIIYVAIQIKKKNYSSPFTTFIEGPELRCDKFTFVTGRKQLEEFHSITLLLMENSW